MADNYLFEPDPLPMPIAAEGNYVVIPEQQATAGDGKASIALGFGPETSKTLDDGGKAVRRQDLNGLFNRLSQILYWVQSGGQWTYKNTVNYAVNCMVVHDNQFYICTIENGPSMGAGVQAPSTNSNYWTPLSKFGSFIVDRSSVNGLTFSTDGLIASYNLTASTQSAITPSGGNGYFTINTFTVNSGTIPSGTYQVKDILQRLINASHTHSARSVSGNGTNQYCSYCSYCDYCRVCCDDCCHDCSDDTY